MAWQIGRRYKPVYGVRLASVSDTSAELVSVVDSHEEIPLDPPAGYPASMSQTVGDNGADSTFDPSDFGFPSMLPSGSQWYDLGTGGLVTLTHDYYLIDWQADYMHGYSQSEGTIDTGLIDGRAWYEAVPPDEADAQGAADAAQAEEEGTDFVPFLGGSGVGYTFNTGVARNVYDRDSSYNSEHLYTGADFCHYGAQFISGNSYFEGNVYFDPWLYFCGSQKEDSEGSMCFPPLNVYCSCYPAFVQYDVRPGWGSRNVLTSFYLPDDGYTLDLAIAAHHACFRRSDAVESACSEDLCHCSRLNQVSIVYNNLIPWVDAGFLTRHVHTSYYQRYRNNEAVFPLKRKRGFKGKRGGGGIEGDGLIPIIIGIETLGQFGLPENIVPLPIKLWDFLGDKES